MVHWSFTRVQACSRHMPQQLSANRPQQVEAAFPSSPSGGFASFIDGAKFSAVALESPNPTLSPPRNNFFMSNSNCWKLSLLYACVLGAQRFTQMVQREKGTILIFYFIPMQSSTFFNRNCSGGFFPSSLCTRTMFMQVYSDRTLF